MVTSVCLHNAFTTCMPGAQWAQKRVSDALELVINGCKPPCWYWELNMGPLTRATSTLNCQAISPAPHRGSKKNSITLTLCVCACAHMLHLKSTCKKICMWRSENNFREELVLTFLHMGPPWGRSTLWFSLWRGTEEDTHHWLLVSPSFQQTVSVAWKQHFHILMSFSEKTLLTKIF